MRTAPSKFGPHHFTSCFMRDLYLHCFDVSDMSELYVLKMTPSRIFPFALDWIFLYLNCTRKTGEFTVHQKAKTNPQTQLLT